ncbi:unnamed protein product [Dibothriocephalus latus]|uniref:Uncharacterized protein n=1 Tax=Dibothriocephalus latus TaxID=60516 RepID=A0A3P7LR72_DIBLA|nr:unnamed protein product [Dibothriocephalus latus]
MIRSSVFLKFGRFDVEHPAENLFQNDSLWYTTLEPKRYILMHDAVLKEDTKSIIGAIRSGYHVDIRDQYYKTPLMVAASDGNIKMTRLLIQLGADVNARDNFWWSPLHHASHSGMVDVVELLLGQGAEIDARALNGATPLFRAIETSRAAVVNLLITKGASITLETTQGVLTKPPLHAPKKFLLFLIKYQRINMDCKRLTDLVEGQECPLAPSNSL